MAEPRHRGPFASPRVSVTNISVDCHLESNATSGGRSAKPGGNTPQAGSRGATDSHTLISTSGGALPAGASPLGRHSHQVRAVSSPMPPNASFPPSRPTAIKQALAQQQLSPTGRSSRTKIAPEGHSGPTEEVLANGSLSRVPLPPGSPLDGTPSGSFRAGRVLDAVPGVEPSHPQQPAMHSSPAAPTLQLPAPMPQLSERSRPASTSLNGVVPFSGGPGAGLISSPSFKASAAPAGPGVVVVKDAVKLVVHHYRAADDDSDEEDDADASRQNSAASDGGGPAQPQGPQVSGLVRFLAVICCMAPAKPQRKKRRRRRSRKPSALSSDVLAPEEHLIGAHERTTDFKGKYQQAQAKAQALVPVPALKRCASNAGFAVLPSADASGHGTSVSGTATDGTRTVSGGPRPPPSYEISPFAMHSMPTGGSPVSRTASLRSPGGVRLGGMRTSPMQSQSVDGYMDVAGWSPVATADRGGSGGGGSGTLSGGSPEAYIRNAMVAGDSGRGLSRISSFDGRSSSGPLPAQPVEPSDHLVQCFKLELAAGASACLDGAGSMAPDALSARHHERTITGGSVSGYGKRGVRWQ